MAKAKKKAKDAASPKELAEILKDQTSADELRQMVKIKVLARPDQGFWRAGHKFTREAREVEVTLDQALACMAEPELTVTVVDPATQEMLAKLLADDKADEKAD